MPGSIGLTDGIHTVSFALSVLRNRQPHLTGRLVRDLAKGAIFGLSLLFFRIRKVSLTPLFLQPVVVPHWHFTICCV